MSTVLASQGSAQNAISSTKNAMIECYNFILQAEGAGANVDSLMPQLNEAAELLSTAELFYDSGDYDAVYMYASQSQSRLNGLTDQADVLRQDAIINSEHNFQLFILTLSVSIAVFFSGVVVWYVLNKQARL